MKDEGNYVDLSKNYEIDNEIDEYLSYVVIDEGLSNKTKDSYSYELNFYRNYLLKNGITPIKDVTVKDVQKFLQSNPNLKSRSIAHRLTVIKNFHQFLVKSSIIKEDVTSNLKGPKLEKNLPNTLSVEEVDNLLNIECKTVYDYRNKAILELLYSTGLRISEALNLTFHDISFTSCTIRVVGKGSKERIVPISDIALNNLNNYFEVRELINKKRSDYLFLNPSGNK